MGDLPMSTTTVNKNLTRASQCFGWAVRNGYMASNPAENVTLSDNRKAYEQRQIFTVDNLKSLFHSLEYVEDDFRFSYQFWLPVIGLFTGMRIEEICQLHLEDIRLEQGIWVFDLFEKREDKRKTAAGQRYIPLHEFLIQDLNLPGRVQYLQDAGYARLFPELDRDKKYGKFSLRAGKWFNERFKRKCGITDKGKAFHSFRHTFINHLKQQGADPIVMQELGGHEFQGETLSRYSKKFEPAPLYERGIKFIDYEGLGLDLSHLVRSKFVQGK